MREAVDHQDEITIKRVLARKRDGQEAFVSDFRAFHADRVAWAGDPRVHQFTVQAQGDVERVFRRQVGFIDLMRGEAARLDGIAVAGRNDGRDHQPQAALLEIQRLGVAQGNGAVFLCGQVPQVHAVPAVGRDLQHDGRVAFGKRFFVFGFGTFLCNDRA